jgi:hypothetical protein
MRAVALGACKSAALVRVEANWHAGPERVELDNELYCSLICHRLQEVLCTA